MSILVRSVLLCEVEIKLYKFDGGLEKIIAEENLLKTKTTIRVGSSFNQALYDVVAYLVV